MKIDVYDPSGKKLTPVEIETNGFGKPNTTLLAQALRIYESNGHQKGSKVKTRGEVRGSTRKIYRQKGTGRARHGDNYAPIFVGGGIAHGPTGRVPKNMVLPKKMKRKALASALLTKLENKTIHAVDKIEDLKPQAKQAANLLAKIANHPKESVLIIADSHQDNLYKATRNLQRVTVKRAQLINAQDLISHSVIVATKDSLSILSERITGKMKEIKPVATKKSKKSEKSKSTKKSTK